MAGHLDKPSTSSPSIVDTTPVIHPIFAASTRTWQYIIADRDTKRCAVLDPVRDRCSDKAVMSTTAADAIIDLVKANGYTVDYILETHALSSQCLSAAWYLRMQFSESQGSPPQLCDEVTVSNLQATWRRKYGEENNFSTTIRSGLGDGEEVSLGGESITCMHMPGFGSPHRRAYQVGQNFFGANSIAMLKYNDSTDTRSPSDGLLNATEVDSEDYLGSWATVQRCLSLPNDTRIWREAEDHGPSPHGDPYDLLSDCAAVKEGGASRESEFLARKREESAWAKPPTKKAGGLKARLGTWLAV